MPNFCMTLSYDGTRYNGWQRQGNTPDTIQGRLETALSALLGQPVEVAGSGRRDAGVHARMQTASFRAKTDLPAPELLRRLRAQLPGDIGVLTLAEAGPRFHARLSCCGKTYVYRVWNSETPNVFERRYVYALPQPLDTAAMQRAAALLCGRHDYTSFCANRHMPSPSSGWAMRCACHFRARAFCTTWCASSPARCSRSGSGSGTPARCRIFSPRATAPPPGRQRPPVG